MSTLAQLKILIEKIADGEKNTAAEVRAVLNAFSTSVYLTGDIKEVDCTTAYVLGNFDNTGLGINERVGWAICNGLNGTKNRVGRTSIGYGDTYATVGAEGGSKDHTLTLAQLPKFKVKFKGSTTTSGGSGSNIVNNSNNNTGDVESIEIGGGESHNNMQPYIVTLMIQKL